MSLTRFLNFFSKFWVSKSVSMRADFIENRPKIRYNFLRKLIKGGGYEEVIIYKQGHTFSL